MITIIAFHERFNINYVYEAFFLAVLMFWAVSLVVKAFVNNRRGTSVAQKVVASVIFFFMWFLVLYWVIAE